MANIIIESAAPLYDGMPQTFHAPCDCTAVTGVTVNYEEASQTFTFRDAHGNDLSGIGNLFMEGALVKVLLDTVHSYAFIQNADTNAYIEGELAKKSPAYTYGTEDLVAGESPLETGKLYFVYE